ncbi:hypothetical protein [Paucibacter sp. XJ19-41]|uniref:hypothetical protein n=1 Tax=Paucibacter sp. XJ19-41 TaxID=2927824 RepID=UPI0023491E80|nr:hypothetical protein [Paucibacter sp. XJ19-41]MDC6167066.1 hypothetical protein [Paucibacter sp. XJ19-41]
MTHAHEFSQVLPGKRSSTPCGTEFVAYSLAAMFKLMAWLLVMGMALMGISPGLAMLCFAGGSVAALVVLLRG